MLVYLLLQLDFESASTSTEYAVVGLYYILRLQYKVTYIVVSPLGKIKRGLSHWPYHKLALGVKEKENQLLLRCQWSGKDILTMKDRWYCRWPAIWELLLPCWIPILDRAERRIVSLLRFHSQNHINWIDCSPFGIVETVMSARCDCISCQGVLWWNIVDAVLLRPVDSSYVMNIYGCIWSFFVDLDTNWC